jgi:hypothetical protein
MIEKYSNKNIDDKELIFIKFNLIYWSKCWLFDALQLTNIEIYLYFTIYEMNNFDVELDSYLSRSHVVRWISRNETLRESFSRTLVLKSLTHFVIRSLRIWAWSLNRWVRLIEDLTETIEQALLDLRETVRWLGVAYPYSGRGRNNRVAHIKQNINESFDFSFRDVVSWFLLMSYFISLQISINIYMIRHYLKKSEEDKKLKNRKWSVLLRSKLVARLEFTIRDANCWIFRWTRRQIIDYFLHARLFFFDNALKNFIWLIEHLNFRFSHFDSYKRWNKNVFVAVLTMFTVFRDVY